MLAGAVVTDRVTADELFADRDLHVVTDDSDLDLPTPKCVPGPIVRAGEAHVARGVDLAGPDTADAVGRCFAGAELRVTRRRLARSWSG